MSISNRFCFARALFIVAGLTALAATVAAQVSAQPTPVGYGMTSGRLVATAAAVVGLIGVVIGLLALVRPSGLFGSATGRLGVTIAFAAGLIAAAVGGWRAATSTGIGTGGGLAGAIVAVVLGLIAISLGWLALSRSRRAG